MADLAADYHTIRTGAGACWLERDVLSVRGPDAVKFLQGQCSQDVAGLAVGASGWSWVLQPQGKVEALCRVTRVADDHVLLDTDGGWGEALMARLNRFKLRVKADIAPLAWRCLALRGPGVAALTLSPGMVPPGMVPPGVVPPGVVPPGVVPPGIVSLGSVPLGSAAGDGYALDAGWPDLPGVDLLGTYPALPEGVDLVDADALEMARIEAGVPRMGAELTDKTIPAETGLVARTVSFTKGCYTGQELVARIDSRGGHVPRHLRRVVLDGLAPVGASVVAAARAPQREDRMEDEVASKVVGKVVGTLTSVAAHPDGGAVALAYLGRDVDPPAPVTVTWEGGASGGRAELLAPVP